MEYTPITYTASSPTGKLAAALKNQDRYQRFVSLAQRYYMEQGKKGYLFVDWQLPPEEMLDGATWVGWGDDYEPSNEFILVTMVDIPGKPTIIKMRCEREFLSSE